MTAAKTSERPGPSKMRAGLVLALAGCALALALPPSPAVAWEIDPGATPAELEDLHRRLASAGHFYPRHGAGPLGWIGFDVFADLAVSEDFGGASTPAVEGSAPLDLLGVLRVGARKGLGKRLGVGVSLARLDEEVELAAVEASWALLEGGVTKPALALRVSVTETLSPGDYDLSIRSVELMASKGLAVVTPYAGIGLLDSEGRFPNAIEPASFDETTTTAFAGVVLHMLLPRLTFAIERAEGTQAVVRVGFGF